VTAWAYEIPPSPRRSDSSGVMIEWDRLESVPYPASDSADASDGTSRSADSSIAEIG
jgi:hypothetical protein